MTLKTLATTLVLLLAPAAFAHEGGPHGPGGPHMMMGPEVALPGVLGDRPEPKEGPCAELKLDKEEKAALKDAYFKFRDSEVDLEAKVKRAHLAKEKLDSDAGADFAAAEAASSAIGEAMGTIMKAVETYHNTVLYKILKPEQRPVARACWHEEGHHFGPPPHDHEGHEKDRPDFRKKEKKG